MIVSGPPTLPCRRPHDLLRLNSVRQARVIRLTSVRPPRVIRPNPVRPPRIIFICLATFLLACAAGDRLAADPSSAVTSPGALAAAAPLSVPHSSPTPAPPQGSAELEAFKAWLQKSHPGYQCDVGPAPFRNQVVETAYKGQRFYYVMTHLSGFRPPAPNSLSLVARAADAGGFEPLNQSNLATFQRGLMKVGKAAQARRAAAAVLILALGDPMQRRWPIKEDLIEVKRERAGWLCTFHHDPNHASLVKFDRHGALSAITPGPPPVA